MNSSKSNDTGNTLVLILAILVIVGGFVVFAWNPGIGGIGKQIATPSESSDSQLNESEQEIPSEAVESVTVNLTQLPLGDKKVSTEPQVGSIYSCQTTFNGGGAFTAGPWIDFTSNTWDLTRKVTVDGNVTWDNPLVNVTVEGDSRILTSNGLPSHATGVYPIAQTDDAYQYDRNPNRIQEQSLKLTLSANPTVAEAPSCVGGEVGMMLTGIPIFNGFDAGGLDAVAHEIQDACGGHPQRDGLYHYHGPNTCLNDDSMNESHSELVGYAFDGFGLFGLRGVQGQMLSTVDLDECHGHTHTIAWDGVEKEMYHYHLTYDFPYSVGCYRGTPAVKGPLGN